MADNPPEDAVERIVRHVLAAGRGVPLADLARRFLRPASAPWLAERVTRSILEADARVVERPDGLWAPARRVEPRTPVGYTVLEAPVLTQGRRQAQIEAAALRVDERGAVGEALELLVRPSPTWPDAALPVRLRGRLREAPDFAGAVERLADFAEGTTLVSHAESPLLKAVNRRLIGAGRVAPVLLTRRLSRSLLGRAAGRDADEMCRRLGIVIPVIETPLEAAGATARALAAFITRVGEETDAPAASAELLARQNPPREAPDFQTYAFTRRDLARLPSEPGVYVMRDRAGSVVYVGKASDLRQRVSSYFLPRLDEDERVEVILGQVHTIETRLAGSELEALLMEHRAIRDLRPRLNQQAEVRDRPHARGAAARRTIVAVPSARPRCAELFLARGVEALARARYSRRWREKAGQAVKDFFFGHPPAPPTDPAEVRLFWSWRARRADAVHELNVNAAGDPDSVARLACELAEDVLRGRERAFRV